MTSRKTSPIATLPPFDSETKAFNVVIETPRGSRNKFKFDENQNVFLLKKVLPAGAVFPYDFGYLPGTLGDDGDPLDVLLLMDTPAFPGCVVHCRLIGVIEARQKEDGKKPVRNDRLVGVAVEAHDYRDLQTLKDMSSTLLKELEWFFVSYNKIEGKEFKLIAAHGPAQAQILFERGLEKAKKHAKNKK